MRPNQRRLPLLILPGVVALCGCPPTAMRASADPSKRERVTGAVIAPDGQPVSGARVGALQPDVTLSEPMGPLTLESLYTTTTDAAGIFVMESWGYGSAPPPHSAWSIWARDDARDLMGAVTMTTAPEGPLEIHLAPASYLHTSVLDAKGTPVTDVGVAIWVAKVGLTIAGPSTDQQGCVRVGPLPANVPFRLHPTANLRYLALTDDWWNETQPEVTLEADETREVPPLQLAVADRTLSGLVQDGNGRPVVGARVRALIPTAFPLSASTDAEGRFALAGPMPTRANVWILASHPHLPLYVAHTISPQTTECRLVLRPLASATGVLADADGRGVEGGRVEAVRALRVSGGRDQERWHLDGLPRGNVARTDRDGLWTIDSLVSGAPYVLLVEAPGIGLARWGMAFIADAGRPVDLGLVMPER